VLSLHFLYPPNPYWSSVDVFSSYPTLLNLCASNLRSTRVLSARSARVVCAIDKTREGEYPHPHDDDYAFGDITRRVIRDVTGNKDYEFGDGSKVLAAATTDAAEAAAAAVIDAGGTAIEAGAAAKAVLDDSGYEFGDLTRGAIKGWEEIVRDATGNEEYKFGDITKGLAKGLFGAMEKGAAAAKKKIDD